MDYIENINNSNDVEINEKSKLKKNFLKKFSISFLVFLACVGVGASAYYIYETFRPHVNHNTTEQSNFIRERTMSIRLNTYPNEGNIKQMFGTTWIIGQDSVDKTKFYMATNMHVIAEGIIAPNNDLTLPTDSNSTYSINKKYINSVTLSFPDPENPHVINTNKNDLLEETFTSSYLPTIEYVATSYNKFEYLPPGGSRTKIPYSMSDLAILGFDSSKSTQNFKDYLNFNYLKSPTRFALNPAGPSVKDDYFIGGYPFDSATRKGVWKFGDSYNDSKRKSNGLAEIIPNFSTGDLTINSRSPSYPKMTKIHGSDTGTIFPLYIDYASTQTPAVKYENYAFQNISEQIIISDLNLGPGSSGSMAINKDNEVVGIYWGAYKGSRSFGAFDCFISQTYNYNLLKDIKLTIKTISNGNWDQV